MQRAKIGLALGSGAARGWAHIGIIEALEEAGPRLPTGHLEVFEDLVDRDRQRFFVSFSTRAWIRVRPSGANQKSRKGSVSRAASNRASASARERRLISAWAARG